MVVGAGYVGLIKILDRKTVSARGSTENRASS